MSAKKRSKFNLTPIILLIPIFILSAFLEHMIDIAPQALSMSWDSALLFLLIFSAVFILMIFLAFRRAYLEYFPPRRDEPRNRDFPT